MNREFYKAGDVSRGRPYVKDIPFKMNKMTYFCPHSNCSTLTRHRFAFAVEMYDFWSCDECTSLDYRHEYDHLKGRKPQ